MNDLTTTGTLLMAQYAGEPSHFYTDFASSGYVVLGILCLIVLGLLFLTDLL